VLFETGAHPDDSVLDVNSALPRQPIVLTLDGVTQVDRDPDWVFSELHDLSLIHI